MAAEQLLWLARRSGNSLPDSLRDPTVTKDNFNYLMKTFLFSASSPISALDGLGQCAPQMYVVLTYCAVESFPRSR